MALTYLQNVPAGVFLISADQQGEERFLIVQPFHLLENFIEIVIRAVKCSGDVPATKL